MVADATRTVGALAPPREVVLPGALLLESRTPDVVIAYALLRCTDPPTTRPTRLSVRARPAESRLLHFP